jgi:hypothetical protein
LEGRTEGTATRVINWRGRGWSVTTTERSVSTIRETAGMLKTILSKRDRLTETELIAFREMLQLVTRGWHISDRQYAWATQVLRRVAA